MTKKNILLIGITPPPINGQTIAFQLLSNEMNCDVLTLSGNRHGNLIGFLGKIWVYLGLLAKLIFKIIRKKYVVYHTISQSIEGFIRDFPIVFLVRILGSKIVLHIHGGNYDNFYHTQNQITKLLIVRMLISSNAIIVLSEKLKAMLDFAPSLQSKIKVVSNGLPWSLVHETLINKELPLDKISPIKILFLSNLIESKGYWSVLEAVEILVNQFGQNIQADFCGEFIQYNDAIRFENAKDAQQHFFEFTTKYHLANHVKYHGVVDEEAKKELLQNAHFFILPTQYKNEGQPISIIEAMAYACVVLTTDYRGISAMIQPNNSGIFVAYNQPNSIVEQVKILLENPEKFNKISQNALRNFQENFTKEKHLQNLIYEIESQAEDKTAIEFHSETATQFHEKYNLSPQFQERYKVWTKLIDQYIHSNMSVLDAGCGSGIFSYYLASKNCVVIGVDGSEEMIKICRNNYAQISFIHDYLPFKNQVQYTKQDAIICSSVLEYTSDYETIIKQFSTTLNPAGILMVSMPNDDCWYRKIEKYIFRFTGKPTYYPHLKQVMKANDFSRKLTEYGFDLLELQYYPNTNLLTKTLNHIGLHPKYTHTMFVGVYKLRRNYYQI